MICKSKSEYAIPENIIKNGYIDFRSEPYNLILDVEFPDFDILDSHDSSHLARQIIYHQSLVYCYERFGYLVSFVRHASRLTFIKIIYK
jgi:hypothetical protein